MRESEVRTASLAHGLSRTDPITPPDNRGESGCEISETGPEQERCDRRPICAREAVCKTGRV